MHGIVLYSQKTYEVFSSFVPYTKQGKTLQKAENKCVKPKARSGRWAKSSTFIGKLVLYDYLIIS